MKSTYVEAAAGIGIAVILFLAGFFVAVVINIRPDEIGDLATWAGALGAFLAFVGTIWVATSETRRRHRAELITAQLVAASMVLRLAHAGGVVAEVCRGLAEQELIDQGLDAFLKHADNLESIDRWSKDDLLPLIAIPMIAVQLAEAGDQVDSAIKILRKMPTKPKYAFGPERMAFALNIRVLLSKTHKTLDDTVIECRKAADALQFRSFR